MTTIDGKALVIASFLVFSVYFPASASDKNLPGQGIIPSEKSTSGDADSSHLTSIITLRWTAPGDDGNMGRAARYDMRFRQTLFGPIDTEAEWALAIPLNNEPAPSPAGQRDSMNVTGLLPGTQYYFCIRTFDEANNISDLSNSPLIIVFIVPDDVISGDVNNSGDVNGLDIVFLVNALKGRSTIPEPHSRADINGIPGVNGLDLAYLRAYLSGGPALKPAGEKFGDPSEIAHSR